MASFSAGDDLIGMIKQIETFSDKDDVYQEMVSAGQEIMKSAIQNGASKHRKTGHMASSVYAPKPYKDKNGNWTGRVKFEGTDGVYKTKAGKKYDMTNWLKAFRLEYGTSDQPATPFVRPAIVESEEKINQKMKEIFDGKMGELQ